MYFVALGIFWNKVRIFLINTSVFFSTQKNVLELCVVLILAALKVAINDQQLQVVIDVWKAKSLIYTNL